MEFSETESCKSVDHLSVKVYIESGKNGFQNQVQSLCEKHSYFLQKTLELLIGMWPLIPQTEHTIWMPRNMVAPEVVSLAPNHAVPMLSASQLLPK